MRTPLVTVSGLSGVAALVVLVSLATGWWPGGPAADGATDGPVIANAEEWNAYPLALVQGRLELVDGCLLLGDDVVFWPHGTTWDEERQSVEFDDAPAAAVGARFSGGGGYLSLENVRGLDGVDADAVARCLRDTGAGGAVFAYPSD